MSKCPHCRDGLVYRPSSLDPEFCDRCNGTGYSGDPRFLAIAFITYICLGGIAAYLLITQPY